MHCVAKPDEPAQPSWHYPAWCKQAFDYAPFAEPHWKSNTTILTKRFAYRAGIQIGARDFEQVYAGDINGDAFDDVVGVYDDGSFEIFLTVHDVTNAHLDASGGTGFHSMGVQTLLMGHRITTVNFIGTLFGYGTNCRGDDWGCTSSGQRAVFVGTEDTDDYVWVSPNVATFPPPAPTPPAPPPHALSTDLYGRMHHHNYSRLVRCELCLSLK